MRLTTQTRERKRNLPTAVRVTPCETNVLQQQGVPCNLVSYTTNAVSMSPWILNATGLACEPLCFLKEYANKRFVLLTAWDGIITPQQLFAHQFSLISLFFQTSKLSGFFIICNFRFCGSFQNRKKYDHTPPSSLHPSIHVLWRVGPCKRFPCQVLCCMVPGSTLQ